ncbi:hypothetical protein ACFU9X_11405 [Streptomyces atratus]
MPNRSDPTPTSGSSTHCARFPGFLSHQATTTPTINSHTPAHLP